MVLQCVVYVLILLVTYTLILRFKFDACYSMKEYKFLFTKNKTLQDKVKLYLSIIGSVSLIEAG